MNARRFVFVRSVLAALALLGTGLVAPWAHAGLYDHEKQSVTSGDLEDIDYWNAKWNMERLEEAIKSHQPEGAIAVQLGAEQRALDELLRKYPNHQELKQWRERAAQVLAQIDPNANRMEEFREGCLWAEGDYRLAYATYGAAKLAAAHRHWEEAHDWARMAVENFGYLRQRLGKNDRVANWPPEFVTWINQTAPQAEQLKAETAKHLH